MPSEIIRVEHVEKSYGQGSSQPRVKVLDRVSFQAQKGEFVGLMGSSGSGKTTLLNLIGGLDTPDAGTIEVAGQNLQSWDDDRRSRFRLEHIGFVFQFFNLLPNLTVLENIAMPLLFLNKPEKQSRETAQEYANEVGLGEKTSRMVHQLSGGEMQRVGLARALAHRPSVLLADEPTGNLDSKTGEAILELIRRTASNHGVTVLMATHDANASGHCDRIVRMVDGRVVSES